MTDSKTPQNAALQEQLNDAQLVEQLAQARVSTIAALTPSVPATITKDSAASSGTTGLGDVLAQMDAEFLARDIAAIALNHIHGMSSSEASSIRVITDIATLSDIGTSMMIDKQITQLKKQADAYIAKITGSSDHPDATPVEHLESGNKGESAPKGTIRPDAIIPSPVLALPAAGNLIGQALTLISQMIAGTYQYSGQAIPATDIAGLDALVGMALQEAQQGEASSRIDVHIDRFEPVLPDAEIFEAISGLASLVDGDLGSAIAKAVSSATENESGGASTSGSADAQSQAQLGQALATAINTFVSSAMTAPANGGRPPVLQAAHGKALQQPKSLLLYARVIAAGDDLTIGGTLLHDRWANLTGVSAEYALLNPSGGVLRTGVRTVLAGSTASIRDGIKDFESARIYPPSVGRTH